MFAVSLLAMAAVAPAALTPTRLRCEFTDNPVGIDETEPRLSWILESPKRGDTQSAYQIVVSSTQDLLRKDQGDLWDSGKVLSQESLHIAYGGWPLKSRQRAWWKVRVWDSAGAASDWSKPAFFEMGLLDRSDWQAKWIGLRSKLPQAPTTEDVKWLWLAGVEASKGAPEGQTIFLEKSYVAPSGRKITNAHAWIAADNRFAFINSRLGTESRGEGFRTWHFVDLTEAISPDQSVHLLFRAQNDGGPAGFAAVAYLTLDDGSQIRIPTDDSWKASTEMGKIVEAAGQVGAIGDQPWGKPNSSPPGGPAPYLRRDFHVAKPVRSARIYASAKGLYEAYVDGKKIGEDFFRPGWTEYKNRIQYQTYDVTNLLKQGQHAVGMILGDGWYCGHVGWSGRCQYGPQPMGLLQLELEYQDGSSETIATGDSGWTVFTGPILKNDLLMGEVYDATLENPNWCSPEVSRKDESPLVEEFGTIPLVAQKGPSVKAVEELKPISLGEPKPGVFVYDLGQNMVGIVRLKVKGPRGAEVKLRHAEMLNPDGTLYTTNLRSARQEDAYRLRGSGTEVYEPRFTFHGFRYVEVTGHPGKPALNDITGVVLTTDAPRTGSLQTSSPMVNQLVHNIFWGQRGNYLEVPTDCPQRDERLGWMGDAQIFIRTATFNNDIHSFMQKWTLDVEDAQSKEGGFSDVTPRIVDLMDGAPAWGDAGVIVPWTIYEQYGDERLLQRRYDSMVAWVRYISEENPSHLWIKRRNNDFGDWLNVQEDTPREVLGTAFYAHSTNLVAKAAKALGRTDDARRYAELFDNIKSAFLTEYVDAGARIKGDSQTSYVIALRFGLYTDELKPKFVARLREKVMNERSGHLSTGFVGVGHITPALTDNGQEDVAFRLLMNETYPSWGYEIKNGATTIWERWDGWTHDKGFQDPGMNSFNHYAFGAVGEWLMDYVLGIDQADGSVGFRHIKIAPHGGGVLTHAKGSYDSIRGRIDVSWKLDGKRYRLDVTLPANTVADIHMPSGATQVTEGGKPAGESQDLRQLDGGVFRAGGGKYRFEARLP